MTLISLQKKYNIYIPIPLDAPVPSIPLLSPSERRRYRLQGELQLVKYRTISQPSLNPKLAALKSLQFPRPVWHILCDMHESFFSCVISPSLQITSVWMTVLELDLTCRRSQSYTKKWDICTNMLFVFINLDYVWKRIIEYAKLKCYLLPHQTRTKQANTICDEVEDGNSWQSVANSLKQWQSTVEILHTIA